MIVEQQHEKEGVRINLQGVVGYFVLKHKVLSGAERKCQCFI